MSFTDDLLEEAQPLFVAQLEHPFVRGIGDGSLDPALFANWVRQDYCYLIEYARVFGYCAARADTLSSMAWHAEALNLTLALEMDLHRKYAARFGISAAELERESVWPTTRAYADFLLRAASEGTYAEAVAALLPCTWGYVDLARRLASGGPPGDQRYRDWIEQYSDSAFVAAAEWLGAELDRLAESCDTAARERLRSLFLESCRHELAFWEMCWRGEG